jgi:serine/threonine protein kinase
MTHAPDYSGCTIDGYGIGPLLGRGGMASVFKAFDPSLQREVAIKIFPEADLDMKERLQRFERETRLIAQVNHLNIAHVFNIGQVDDCPYYVMEYIKGCSLGDLLIERNRLPPSQVVDIMLQVSKGLRAAAEH